jgi:hypothetical protein
MTSSCFKKTIRRTVVALTILSAFPTPFFAQQPQAICRASLETYVLDKSLNAHWEGNTVVMKRGGVEYVCRCVSETQPPDCKPRNSSGAGGLSGVDITRFKPGQQLALMATQSLIQGLFKSIFSAGEPAGSAEAALQRQQNRLKEQEEARLQALENWGLFQEEEKARAQREQEANRMIGQNLLEKIGGTGGQGLGYQSISGEKLEFNDWAARKPEAIPLPSGKYPAPKTAGTRSAAAYAALKNRLARNIEVLYQRITD